LQGICHLPNIFGYGGEYLERTPKFMCVINLLYIFSSRIFFYKNLTEFCHLDSAMTTPEENVTVEGRMSGKGGEPRAAGRSILHTNEA
jgi:hypothetical protein